MRRHTGLALIKNLGEQQDALQKVHDLFRAGTPFGTTPTTTHEFGSKGHPSTRVRHMFPLVKTVRVRNLMEGTPDH